MAQDLKERIPQLQELLADITASIEGGEHIPDNQVGSDIKAPQVTDGTMKAFKEAQRKKQDANEGW